METEIRIGRNEFVEVEEDEDMAGAANDYFGIPLGCAPKYSD